MKPVERTPSVNFIFEDEHEQFSHSINHQVQTEVKYQFSQTNQKEGYSSHKSIVPIQVNINKILAFPTTPSIHSIKTEEFFQEFQSKFVVSFEEEGAQNSRKQDLIKKNVIQNEQQTDRKLQKTQQIFNQVRLSLPESKREVNNLSLSINNIENLSFQISNFNSLSSVNQILKNNNTEKLPQIIHSDKINHKKTHFQSNLYLPQLHHPKKCKISTSNLYFTSKATPRDFNIAKKAYNKYCLKVQPIVKDIIFQSKTSFSKKKKTTEKDQKRYFSQLNKQLVHQKSNIFIRLPSLR